ncbi:transcriptional regulator [Paraclostridium sordellii]|uniref:transcriptional regulator n=1 Tax=Paraclostridium sordellii TaxID=1505 RepID=UPI0005DFA417|nr:transcriptional regulator [Paeniclostridium sordellii]CEO25504.1 Helix-turn-helix domain [[Clostridium] sordellii] [Paeniclostridium sordellii]CEQ12905.1 Helix-turn-helix domain [[Clostridium] sordellii] [Paeniclostridium sordellii]
MDKCSEISNTIRFIRKQKNITTQNVANFLQINQGSYTLKETSKSPISMTEFIDICDFLKIELNMSYELNNQVNIISNDYKELVKAIVLLRKNKEITKDNFRFMLDMSLPNYLNKENLKSKKPFYLSEIIKIAEILGINISIKYTSVYICENKKEIREKKELKIV